MINRIIVFALIILDLFLLVVIRFLTLISPLMGVASVIQEILGISLLSTFIVTLQCFARAMFERGIIRKKLNYASIASLNIVAAFSIMNYVILPFAEPFPSSNRIIFLLTPFVLIAGLSLFVVLAGLSILRRTSRSGDAHAARELTHYHGKSLIFKGRTKNVALCILKLMSRSTPDSGSTANRELLRKNVNAYSNRLENGSLDYSHLTSLWSNVPDFSIEFTIENGLTSVSFFTSAADTDTDRAAKLAEEKAEKLRSVLQTRFKTKIDFLQSYQLWSAYGSILGRDSPYMIEPGSAVLKVGGIQGSEKQFIAVSALKRRSDTTATVETPKTRVGEFLSTFAGERLSVSMVVHFEATSPPSIPSEAKLVEKARHEPDMKVLLELSEKRREVREERHAQQSGYWNVSAYAVYRGNTEQETRMLQEKGDAGIEAVYSSASGRVKGEKLGGKRISKCLKIIAFRGDIGVTTMKVSSRLAAELIELPERHIAGIPETDTPVFNLPAREELENGEITIGTVMHDENEICPLRIKLDDLMLHTVIFGETGYGKTRLIMSLLRGIPASDVAWTLIEMKGEYRPLVKLIDNVVYLRPASKTAPLRINLFDSQTEKPETHAKRLFAILKETFSTLFTDQSRELSAQMERVFYDAIVTYITSTTYPDREDIRHNEDKTRTSMAYQQRDMDTEPIRNWAGFNRWLQNHARRYGLTSLPQIESTIQALLNRLDSFTRSPLSEVFNHDRSNVCFDDLVKRRTIIDLSEIKAHGTAEDLRLISNIITKYVAAAAQQRGIQDRLRHILVIDDALEVVPEILTKRTTAETGITEQMVLLLRATGQGVIISTQRPNISQNILANAATKVFLRTTVDSEKAAKWLNLSDEQASYLRVMPKMEAIVVTPKHSKPIRIRTPQMDLPRVDDHDIIVNDMINYPVIYDTETKDLRVEVAARNDGDRRIVITGEAQLKVDRLRNMAEEACQAGNYREALRTYVTAIDVMKNKVGQEDELTDGTVERRNASVGHLENPLTKSRRTPLPLPLPSSSQTQQPPNEGRSLSFEPQTEQMPKGNQQTASKPDHQSSLTPEERLIWVQVKEAFKYPQEIVDETALKTRLDIEADRQLQKRIEPLIVSNLVGVVTAPSYKNASPPTTRIYYQISDHEDRDVLQEHVTTTIYKDLHSKGINTTWIDQNMELLATINGGHDQNQYVITTWTHNTMNPATILTRLRRTRQQLQNEQIKELIIVTPWRNEAKKLQKLITYLRLSGIIPMSFNENETNRLINHITYGAPLNP